MNEMQQILCLEILKEELIPALGCTEPITIAYAAAKARKILGEIPDHIDIYCSGNIIKNVKGVMVPNSGGIRGVDAAAILGAVGGNADSVLNVLETVTEEHREECKKLMQQNYAEVFLAEGVANLYVKVVVTKDEHFASITLVSNHTNITEIVKDGEVLYSQQHPDSAEEEQNWGLSIETILDFAKNVSVEKLIPIIKPQIELNTAIAEEGLKNHWGQWVGHTMLTYCGDNIFIRAKAKAAAGSDARMGGCSMPVVINSGSGNQGLTVSLPVIEYANEWQVGEEKLYRALAISNLISIHLKHYIGTLSAFCGAVTAGAAAGAAITYLAGGTDEQIGNTIINALGNVSGIVCDGAKSSCAAKIASAVEAGILGHYMAMEDHSFQPGEGLVQQNLEDSIRSFGYMGRVGMKQTDIEVLNIMIEKTKP